MILFQSLRTSRVCVRMQELTLGQAGAMCRDAPDRQELTTTNMLRAVAGGAIAPTKSYETDPLFWTVQERNYVLSMYLAQVLSDGPDFAIAGDIRLSAYVDPSRDLQSHSTLVEPEKERGDSHAFRVWPLLGVHTQALEVMVSSAGEWQLGAIACCVFRDGDTPPDWRAMSEQGVQEWIEARTLGLDDLPESEFEGMFLAWERGQENLWHFFRIRFDDAGVCLAPLPEKDREAGGVMPLARFRAISAISPVTKRLYAKSARASSSPSPVR